MSPLVVAIIDGVALVVCGIAAAIDLRQRRIPNWLTGSAALCGLVLNAGLGLVAGGSSVAIHALLGAIAGGLLGLVVWGAPAALDLFGMGDVKLVIAIGALVRWPLALQLALYTAVAGGLVALGYAARRPRDRRMPYGLAILVGCVWAVASRHVAWLRVLDI